MRAVSTLSVGVEPARHPLLRGHTCPLASPEISLHPRAPTTPTRCDACRPSSTMKTLRLALLAAVAVGCHFDKLFQPSGGVSASRAGAQDRPPPLHDHQQPP